MTMEHDAAAKELARNLGVDWEITPEDTDEEGWCRHSLRVVAGAVIAAAPPPSAAPASPPQDDKLREIAAIASGMLEAFAILAVSTRYDAEDRRRWAAGLEDAQRIASLATAPAAPQDENKPNRFALLVDRLNALAEGEGDIDLDVPIEELPADPPYERLHARITELKMVLGAAQEKARRDQDRAYEASMKARKLREALRGARDMLALQRPEGAMAILLAALAPGAPKWWLDIATAPERVPVLLWRDDQKRAEVGTVDRELIGHPGYAFSLWQPITPPAKEQPRD